MACLGEASRFRLVQILMGGARCVTELASEVGLSQSCTTRHLQALESRRVVAGRREGKRVLYRIRDDDPRLLPLLKWALVHPSTPDTAARPVRARAVRPPTPEPEAGEPEVVEPEVVEPEVVEPEAAGPEPATQPGRRAGGSEIEDYLL
jgi:DNA-binding transcriptional ArsR family regulator